MQCVNFQCDKVKGHPKLTDSLYLQYKSYQGAIEKRNKKKRKMQCANFQFDKVTGHPKLKDSIYLQQKSYQGALEKGNQKKSKHVAQRVNSQLRSV